MSGCAGIRTCPSPISSRSTSSSRIRVLPAPSSARHLLVTAQTMTGLLRRLEKEGSVERRPDPHNRRADRWYLLPAGLERLNAARASGSPGDDTDAVIVVGKGSGRYAQVHGAMCRGAGAGRASRTPAPSPSAAHDRRHRRPVHLSGQVRGRHPARRLRGSIPTACNTIANG